MERETTVFVAGGETHVGAALRRRLIAGGWRIVGADSDEPDYHDRDAVDRFFSAVRPAHVFVAAGMSAGIGGNQRFPADLMRDNLDVASHIIPAAAAHGVRKLMYLATSCVYPKHAPQPMHPDALWTGPLEPTSAAYATAKLTGLVLCQAYRRQYGVPFIAAIGADVYGPDDKFSAEDSHVIGGLMRRMHDAREAGSASLAVWGSGRPEREFIFADDLADACLFAMERYDDEAPINLGTGVRTTIRDLAGMIREVTGYGGELQFDTARPDGIPLKALDSSVLHGLGWRPAVGLRDGLSRVYETFRATGAASRT